MTRDTKLDWIAQIDQVRGVITLTVRALLADESPDHAAAACALDLANEELQRLRNGVDVSWATERSQS